MIKMKVTLADDEGHTRRSKVTRNCGWSYLSNYYTHRHHTWYQGTIQLATSNDISLFDLDLRSRSQLKVKGHRRGAVCVLWMLLVKILFTVSQDRYHLIPCCHLINNNNVIWHFNYISKRVQMNQHFCSERIRTQSLSVCPKVSQPLS